MDHHAPDRRPAGGSRLLTVVLAVLLLAVLATSTVLVLERRNEPDVSPQRPADIGAAGWQDDVAGRAVLTARRAARTYFTLDHRHVERDMDAMRALGTDEFVASYDAGAAALAARVSEQRLRLSAALEPDGAATELLVADRAQVLVTLDVTTVAPTGRRTAPYRTRVVLDLVDDEWLVAAFEEVR
ncbi:hypothetical protein [Nocardioides dongxiaopingii]|uniref:hypothetical protein n=1 Tax=Nocardioides dongxiaopingii TaxID=2576036 RepID=UPI0010C76F89|nr:hypothetical protein [Nocardioides dongxiaopingii]